MKTKKYHFVKIKKINTPSENGTWYLEANSMDMVYEHFEKYVGSIIKEGMSELPSRCVRKAKGEFIGHTTNVWVSQVEMFSSMKGTNIIETAINLENEALKTRINAYSKFNKIYLPIGLQVFLMSDFVEIVEDEYREEMTYPSEDNPKLNDVRYIQWDGGNHWYAKIGVMDITDKHNNQKWDTKEEAIEAARWYLLNKPN